MVTVWSQLQDLELKIQGLGNSYRHNS